LGYVPKKLHWKPIPKFKLKLTFWEKEFKLENFKEQKIDF